jgi:hypothetical protein
MSMFRYVHFLYAIFVMVMIYLQINLKLKLLFFLSAGGALCGKGQRRWRRGDREMRERNEEDGARVGGVGVPLTAPRQI